MMEFSPLYTRRLSGSSARNSFNEDALEQLEFNINDISRASSPASVTSGVSARSEGHGFRERRHRSSTRAEDDYRRRYNRMKTELEIEKSKGRQLQQERVEEMRRLREAFENDRKLELVALQNRLEEEKKKEIARVKEDLIKQKDFELQQVLMYREGEKKQQQPKSPKAEEPKEKEKEEQKKEEKEKNEVEEDEESGGGKDGDNDVATASEKLRTKNLGHQDERRRQRSSLDRRSVDMDSKDGGTSHEHRRTPRELRSSRSQDGYEADKESGGRSRRRGVSVSKMVEKIEKHDMSTAVDEDSLAAELASDNTTSKSGSAAAAVDSVTTSKDSNKEGNAEVSKKDSSTRTSRELLTKKVMKDDQTQTVDNKDDNDEREKEKEKEREALKELQEKISSLESEKVSLVKQREDVQKTLDTKCKEHKIREEEFTNLKAGYERELRTVINEHKKVALGNLEKLKLAETALKEATMSDEEIAMFSQRHDRQRRLSSSSLPALQFEVSS